MRRPRVWIAVGLGVLACVAILLAGLPTIVRRVAVSQIRALTAREAGIDEVQLNLFTRRLAVRGFRLADREGQEPLARFEELEVRFSLVPLVRGRLHLDALVLRGLRLRLVRTGPAELNISDILARFLGGEPRKEPAYVALDRLDLRDAVVTLEDRVVAPPRTWAIAPLDVELRDFVTVGDAQKGAAQIKLTVNGAPVSLSVDQIRARPAHARGTLTITGFDLAPLWPYVPANAPIRAQGGKYSTRLVAEYGADTGVRGGGEVTIEEIAFVRRGEAAPFVTAPRLEMTSSDVVYKDGALSARRLGMKGAPALADASVSPPRTLVLRGLRVGIENLAWPFTGTARVEVAAELPEAGTVDVNGTVALAGPTAELTVAVKDAALAPYQRFLPLEAGVRGRAAASLKVTAALSDALRATAKGSATLSRFAVGPADRPTLSVERVDAEGIDVQWPSRIAVARVRVRKPSALLEREKDGSFPLRAMLTPKVQPASAPAATAAAAPPAPSASRPAAPGQAIEIGELSVEEGDVRFLDRTVTPFYSEEITRLAVTVRGFRNAPNARADLTVQGLLGGTGAFDFRGQVAPFGEPFFLDVAGEMHDFAVPRINPYMTHYVDWLTRSGRLTTKLHYRITGDQLEATNEIVVQRIDVERTPESEASAKKLGLPLGLAVAIMKDSRGDIRLSVPVGGRLSAPEFSLGDIIATAIKNVITKLITAPFRAIGKIFQKDETVEALKIDPAVFEPGSAVPGPETQKQLQRVADFLRASPFLKLALQPVVTEADLASLRTQEVTAKIQRVQREAKLPDFAAAAARVFKAEHPDRPVPKTPEEIVAALREGEPVPEPAARQLATRRVDATREILVAGAGIEPARLESGAAPSPLGASGDGRVEFELRP